LQVALDPRQHGYHKYGERKIEHILMVAQIEYEDCYNKEIYPVQEHYTQYTLTDILTKTIDELIAQE
jgi:hypothetical protein